MYLAMKKTIICLAIIGYLPCLLWGQQKQMCITIDDLPVVHYSIKKQAHLEYITQKLIQTFKDYDIPAIGFVNEKKLYEKGELDSKKVALLEQWLENGYELGNHTYAHPNYNEVGLEVFSADILKGEEVCKPLTKRYKSQYIYFRPNEVLLLPMHNNLE